MEDSCESDSDGQESAPRGKQDTYAAPDVYPTKAYSALLVARAAAIAAAHVAPGRTESSAKNGSAKKRGPGRPPSKPPAPPLAKKGIVDDPDDPSHRLEFVFSDPSVFKSLFTYFKNLKARDIHMRCGRRGLTFFTRDHTKISRVVAHVAGEHVNWHYCAEEFWVGLNRELVEKMFSSIDKSFFKITILQRHDDPETLSLIFKDADVEKDCNYKIAVARLEPDQDLFDAEKIIKSETVREDFPIEFTLTAKQFKKSISDAANYSEEVSVEKIGEHPLQLTYQRVNIVYHEVYHSPEKIRLRSDIEATRNFRCAVKLANIKSLATSMVTDDVRILCRETDYILFRSAIDEKALVVSTLTNIA